MGDLSTVLTNLNLSPINTLLLVALLVALKYIVSGFTARLAKIEKASRRHGRSITFIKQYVPDQEPEFDDE